MCCLFFGVGGVFNIADGFGDGGWGPSCEVMPGPLDYLDDDQVAVGVFGVEGLG